MRGFSPNTQRKQVTSSKPCPHRDFQRPGKNLESDEGAASSRLLAECGWPARFRVGPRHTDITRRDTEGDAEGDGESKEVGGCYINLYTCGGSKRFDGFQASTSLQTCGQQVASSWPGVVVEAGGLLRDRSWGRIAGRRLCKDRRGCKCHFRGGKNGRCGVLQRIPRLSTL